jgi:hypothetical protein
VDLHLSDGTTLKPDCFDERLSQGDYAVFAQRDSDETHMVTAVAWSAIVRIVVRGAKQLPDEMDD